MPRSAYPDSNDCEAILRAQGLFSSSDLASIILDLDLEGKAAAAAAEWERCTGWVPFLGDTVDATRYFDPPGPNQRLPGALGGGYLLTLPETGLLSLTSIHSGFSSASAGTALVSEDDYRLRPLNAGVSTRPYTEIEFLGAPSWGFGRSLRIIGKFGYATTVPEDAWAAILYRAAGYALPEIRERVTGGLVEWKEAEVSERYGEKFLSGSAEAWDLRWKRATDRFKRITL